MNWTTADGRVPSFRIHEIEGYIERIPLIEYEDGLLLFDSGCINDVKRIERYCRYVLKRPPTDIRLIAVTHMHPDHSGGAVRLRSKYGIPIAAHQDVDRWYAGLGGGLQQKLDCYMATTVAFRNKRKLERILFNRRIQPDYPLQDGQTLPIYPEWTALHVPGHTLHDMAFFHQGERTIYIADLICDVKGKLQLPLPILFPRQMAESYERLAATDARKVLRAHGNPITTNDSEELFTKMKVLLNQSPTPFIKRVHRMSVYSPEVRKKLNRR